MTFVQNTYLCINDLQTCIRYIAQPGGFSYHEGDPSDPRMLRTAAARGVKLTSFSRPLKPRDLSRFDYIIGMDDK